MKKKKHHEFGPSCLYRRKECPGSFRMEQGEPEQTNKYAEEGRLLHTAVWVPAEARKKTLGLNEEQLECLKTVDNWLASYEGGSRWIAEKTLSLYDENGEELLFGTADAIKIFPEEKTAVCGDFKFGHTAVNDPIINLQLATYAAAIMQNYCLDSCTAVVVQPRIRQADHPEYTFTNVSGIVRTIKTIIKNCQKEDAPLRPGEHCQYCRAKHKCNAFLGMETAVVSINKQTITKHNVKNLFIAVKQIKKAVASAERMIREFVEENGGDVGGVYIGINDGRRTVAPENVPKLYDELKEYFTLEEFLTFCKPTLPAIEKEVAKKLKENGLCKTINEGKHLFNNIDLIERAPTTTLKIKDEDG